MVLKSKNLASTSGIFNGDSLPSPLTTIDAVVKINQEGNFLMYVSNLSDQPVDISNQTFELEPFIKTVQLRKMKAANEFKVWRNIRPGYPINP